MNDWWIYHGEGSPAERLGRLATLKPPPWREFPGTPDPEYQPPTTEGPAWEQTRKRGAGYLPDDTEVKAVNAALHLRRPLLVTGKPGVGKSTIAHSIAVDLGLGPVLYWPITSRTTRRDGLYLYDAIGRLQDANLRQLRLAAKQPHDLTDGPNALRVEDADQPPDSAIARYLRLGPLGTALLPQRRPRVLLIDEIDKSDIDLPGDLLTLFEESAFEIPELARLAGEQPRVRIGTADTPDPVVHIECGRVQSSVFPIVVLTSNGERDFPPPFLRRCIRLHLDPPGPERLARIVRSRLGLDERESDQHQKLLQEFLDRRADGDLATDQLLNAIQLRLANAWSDPEDHAAFLDTVLQRLTGPTA
ncbi:MoxR-like ATPase [Kitasatospora sp. MAA4]|uniref:AAA family ATPase n=1 Tax=Kitasatospora sp. MAA4 TaxID=3035093 RepID=UPI002476C16F|nr:MoxR family ATPase [Kitasatospora sp. MAA4]MDH6132292.1 MoxR-like ATPase [Kitasatospora sp. MAA4]